MDWLYMYMPIAGFNIFWPGLALIGFSVGVIGGFFGMGGAWMVTPGLNILGFPMAFAIGTDIAHIAGKSMISTFRHSKFGNVDYKLGLYNGCRDRDRNRIRGPGSHVAGTHRQGRSGCAMGLCGSAAPDSPDGLYRLRESP